MIAAANRPDRAPMRKTLIVVAFVFDLPYKAVRGAQHAGYEVHVLGQDTARGFRYSMACAGFRTLAYRPGLDPVAMAVDEIRRHVSDVDACAVIPGDTIATRLLIAIRDRLPVRTCLLPTAALFDTLNDKWLFFQYCRQIGIRVPDTRRVAGPDAVLRGLADGTLTLPLVVKPLLGMASDGMHILRDERDIRRFRALPPTQSGPLLAQRFIEGTDRGISVVARAGTVVAHATQTVRNRRCHLADQPTLRAMAERIVAASGFDGAANFDAVEETATGECYILECNPRFWFTMTTLLAADLNVVALSLAGDAGAAERPATATRTAVPLGRAAITDAIGLAWTPALFAIWRYYLRDIPGVLCGRLPAFQNRRPGRGDIPHQMRQLVALSSQTAATAASAAPAA